MDEAGFDPNAVDEEGLPLVYNEQRISEFWGSRPGELASRWGQFAAISGGWLHAKLQWRGAQLCAYITTRSSWGCCGVWMLPTHRA